ncbi:MAG: type II secretion system F family protein [Nocardiaceae bacterium]|nr:type II secretion system F family protein [Nocardiaceae bacterium]
MSVVLLLLAAAVGVWSGPGRRGATARSAVAYEKKRSDDPLALAGAFDLLATALTAGMALPAAAAVVAKHAPHPLDVALRKAADLTELGAEASAVWAEAARHRETESLARLARRSARSGAAFANAVSELAEAHRQQVENLVRERAERAGVLIAGPLGLCFLPAFVCLGIAPVVVGLASHMGIGGLW